PRPLERCAGPLFAVGPPCAPGGSGARFRRALPFPSSPLIYLLSPFPEGGRGNLRPDIPASPTSLPIHSLFTRCWIGSEYGKAGLCPADSGAIPAFSRKSRQKGILSSACPCWQPLDSHRSSLSLAVTFLR